jgi:hypothetical protein
VGEDFSFSLLLLSESNRRKGLIPWQAGRKKKGTEGFHSEEALPSSVLKVKICE